MENGKLPTCGCSPDSWKRVGVRMENGKTAEISFKKEANEGNIPL
jgi:hypothetical protein